MNTQRIALVTSCFLLILAFLIIFFPNWGKDRLRFDESVYEEQTNNAPIPLLPTSIPAISLDQKNMKEESVIFPEVTNNNSRNKLVHIQLNPLKSSVLVQIRFFDELENELSQLEDEASEEIIHFPIPSNHSSHVLTIIASASGYIPSKYEIKESDLKNDIYIQLYDHVKLSLHVESDWSKKVSGAEVKVTSNSNGIFMNTYFSNKEGQVQIILPTLGIYQISAYHPNYFSSGQKTISIQNNPNIHTMFLKSNEGTIRGTVYDEDITTLPNIKVNLYRLDNNTLISTTNTDQTGKYILFGIRLGEYSIGIEPGKEFIKNDIHYSVNGKEDGLFKSIALTEENSFLEIDFRTKRAVGIEGIVIDEYGNPISQALLKLSIGGARNDSVYPIKDESYSDIEGKFTIPVTTRIKSMSEIKIGAIHPDYENEIVSLTNFDWETKPKSVTIILKSPTNNLKGNVFDVSTGREISFASLTFTQYAFRFRDGFDKNIQSNEDGSFTIILPRGEYEITAQGYSVVSPEITEVGRENADLIVNLKINESETITIKGVVIDRKEDPVNGAHIRIVSSSNKGIPLGFSTVSIPNGSFQMDVPIELLDNTPQIEVDTLEYKYLNKPLLTYPDLEKLKIELDEYGGQIKVYLSGYENLSDVSVHLVSLDGMDSIDIIDAPHSSEIFFKKINPSYSPLIIIAGNNRYFGKSEPIELSNVPSNYAEVHVRIDQQQNDNSLSIKVLDVVTNQPIPIVTCTLNAISIGTYGQPESFYKTAITNFQGIVFFEDLPLLTGTISLKRDQFEMKNINISIEYGDKEKTYIVKLKPV